MLVIPFLFLVTGLALLLAFPGQQVKKGEHSFMIIFLGQTHGVKELIWWELVMMMSLVNPFLYQALVPASQWGLPAIVVPMDSFLALKMAMFEYSSTPHLGIR
jgi:hypothetical protein